ncbi:MAG: NUDIX domain-containing protein, partial [Pedosphaera sp.]|nr:NUDIX domain-containing protein [Pedosphaera sp.]
KIEYGESAENALRREIAEETKLVISDIEFVLTQDCIESEEFYRPEHFILLNYTCRLSGESDVTLNEEAQAFRWVNETEALQLNINEPTRILLDAVMARTAIPADD